MALSCVGVVSCCVVFGKYFRLMSWCHFHVVMDPDTGVFNICDFCIDPKQAGYNGPYDVKAACEHVHDRLVRVLSQQGIPPVDSSKLYPFEQHAVSREASLLRPPRKGCRAQNDEKTVYDEPACCRGESCVSIQLRGSHGNMLRRMTTEHEETQMVLHGVVPSTPDTCILCVRDDITQQSIARNLRTRDDRFGNIIKQPYYVPVEKDDPESYREEFCFVPTVTNGKADCGLLAPFPRFIPEMLEWTYKDGQHYVTQHGMTYRPM